MGILKIYLHSGNTGRRLLKKAVLFLTAAVLALLYVCAAAEGGNWTCPECGHINDAESNFCGGCGSQKPVESVSVENADVNAWVCSSCGKVLSSDKGFCTNCGEPHHDTDAVAILLPEPVLREAKFDPANVRKVDLKSNSDTYEYTFTAEVSGIYSFCPADPNAEMEFKFSVYDSRGNYITGNFSWYNQAKIYVECTEGETYKVVIETFEVPGHLALFVGEARKPQALGSCGIVHDSLDFYMQQNVYVLVPEVDGVYCVEIADAMYEFEVEGEIRDAKGYTLANSGMFRMEKGSSISAELKAGETYYIYISYFTDPGEYTLKIGRPNPSVDISGCAAFGDSIYYDYQENHYTFTAERTGTYRFTLSQVMSDNTFSMAVYDNGNYELGSYNCMYQGNYFEVECTAGQRYALVVRYDYCQGAYSVSITAPD